MWQKEKRQRSSASVAKAKRLLQAREATLGNLSLVTLEEAAAAVGKTTHNIRDYIQRGRISKYGPDGKTLKRARNGELRVSLTEVRAFLSLVEQGLDRHHHAALHADLGFYDVPEYKRTKHVHRLHPYLGKFIPQLVEWFLSRYFKAGDIILDPFMGSGTTLVQANELGMHSVGIDISPFNCHIARVKTDRYDLHKVTSEIFDIKKRVFEFSNEERSPSLFQSARHSRLKEQLLSECKSEYLKTWFAPRCLVEMLYYRDLIPDYEYKDLLRVLLSRAVRSSRLIPHYDLASPKAPLPVGKEYWCRKHKRYCVPIDNCITKIHAYSADTARRLAEFARLRSEAQCVVVQADSRVVDLMEHLDRAHLPRKQIDGIFTSPPYVGQIDYHEQHIYAYELFGFPRQDDLEIGPKSKGKSQRARQDYVEGISDVFRNVLRFLKPDAAVFVVANDRFGLYPDIAKLSGLRIINEFHRAVTKRTEQGDDPYQETIFHMVRES